ncbi:AAA-like domain-containing protein [Armatimonas rosea]|uniref:WD40 repeat protein n=1 Tax=Armatimonas rosea TaxID=685828 RepID=A0A7W9W6Y9_ARMRO|nr:AAA-like domain-containing protein [Armatimonas rosea]MBB6050565.1 WD40 repeat protein [Armatimonas rosea]
MAPFFVTGGTLSADARSYIARSADSELLEALQGGAFCYVLNTRQVGKSSLMIRTAHALRERGVTSVVLDITAGGFNLTPDAWYDGLLLQLAEQLARFLKRPELEETLETAFAARSQLGAAQRFFHVLEQVALPAAGERGLTVFVDEIDAVRLLPFSVDEFFVGIRALYNRRAERAELARLTFCLVGVATPNQLIANPLVSPFNIGKKITLTDFTLTDAAPLAASLPGGSTALARVLHWTGGHPYLTQRLCARLLETGGSVDEAVTSLFFTHAARESDDNLAFVATRLLRGEDDRAALLELYGKVRGGQRVADDPTSPLCDTLHLAGIVRSQPEGTLAVRNRIYAHVFDLVWVRENLPDGELRRQRAAFRRGALRTGALAGGVLAAMGGLTAWALLSARRADEAAQRADREAGSALRAQKTSEQNRTLAQKNQARAERLAQERARALAEKEQALREKEAALQAKESALKDREAALVAEKTARGRADRATVAAQTNLGRVELALALRALGNAETEAAAEHLTAALQQGRLSPEQAQLAQFCQQTITACAPRLRRKIVCRGTPSTALYSSDGSKLAVGTENGWVQVFESVTGKPLSPAYFHGAGVTALAFLSGNRLASGGNDSRIHLWGKGAPTRALVHTVQHAPILDLAPSREGTKLISSGQGGCVVWDTRTGNEISRVWDDDMGGRWTAEKSTKIPYAHVARFSNPQETELAFGAYGYVCNIARVATGQMTRAFSTAQNKAAGPDWAYQFVPTPTPGVIAVIGHYTDGTGNACLYNLETGRAVSPLMVTTNPITRCGSFSPDGKTLAVGDEAGSLLLWEPRSGRPADGPYSLFPPQHFVQQVAWLPDSDRVLAQTLGDPVVLWSKTERRIVTARFRNSRSFTLSPTQPQVAILGTSSTLSLWSIPPRNPSPVLRVHSTNNGLRDEQVAKDSYTWLGWLDSPLESSVVLDLETRRVLQSSRLSLSWSPEGRYVAIHDTSCAEVWDTKLQTRVWRTIVQASPSARVRWEKDQASFIRENGLTEKIPLTQPPK